jgi:hypothetical protein
VPVLLVTSHPIYSTLWYFGLDLYHSGIYMVLECT